MATDHSFLVTWKAAEEMAELLAFTSTESGLAGDAHVIEIEREVIPKCVPKHDLIPAAKTACVMQPVTELPNYSVS